mgnify:CR=1 FL=1
MADGLAECIGALPDGGEGAQPAVAHAADRPARRRVDEVGTREPTIQRQGADRILIQVPGIGSAEELIDLIGTTARLTFHPVVRSTTEGRKQRDLRRVSSTPNRLHVDGNAVAGRIPASRIALGALIDQLSQSDAAQEPVDLIAELGP